MGVCKQPQLDLYWSTKFPLSVHGVADVTTMNCFQQLFRCLHLANNATQIPARHPGHNLLFKDLLTRKFESEYTLHQESETNEVGDKGFCSSGCY